MDAATIHEHISIIDAAVEGLQLEAHTARGSIHEDSAEATRYCMQDEKTTSEQLICLMQVEADLVHACGMDVESIYGKVLETYRSLHQLFDSISTAAADLLYASEGDYNLSSDKFLLPMSKHDLDSPWSEASQYAARIVEIMGLHYKQLLCGVGLCGTGPLDLMEALRQNRGKWLTLKSLVDGASAEEVAFARDIVVSSRESRYKI